VRNCVPRKERGRAPGIKKVVTRKLTRTKKQEGKEQKKEGSDLHFQTWRTDSTSTK
jgi:hypothetical protein